MQLAQKLDSLSSENKKLVEMLTMMCDNYNALQRQYRDLMSKTSHDHENYSETLSPSRKRKAADSEGYTNNSNAIVNSSGLFINGSSAVESSSSDDEYSCKVPKEIKSKISTVYVRVDSSDKTLVSFQVPILKLQTCFGFYLYNLFKKYVMHSSVLIN